MPIFKPLAMEPAIRDAYDDRPRFPPILPKISLLATPQMTPRSTNSNTPAVGVGGFCLGRSSMSLAMKQIHNTCMVRTTLDVWPSTGFQNVPASSSRPFPTSSRRSSLAPSSSSRSSPESMVSDVSSRSSRSSSISSVASSTCALPQPSLAVQATRRCANMQLLGIKEDCQTRMVSPSENGTAWEGYTSSPVSYTLGPRESYIRDTMATSIPRSSLHQFSDQDAAEGLRDLALNRYQRTLPPLSVTSQQPLLPRKRERPSSISDSSLQQSVRGLLQPQCLDNITNCSNNTRTDNVILVDTKIADSFVLHSDFKLPKSSHDRTSSENSRKRTCYMEGYESGMGLGERAGLPTLATGPGMWTGIL
ncbi:hypothetical protein MMC13_004145 [Lambiella insularis]|nr:hypothetical protein [Lambiella insularis]